MQVLREVAARGSFSAAAQALWMTQPAVSRQVAALEREAGVALLEREPRGVRVTEAGRIVLEHADAIAGHLGAARAELDALLAVETGRVRVATFPTAGSTLVLDAVRTFHARHPRVELSITEALRADGLERLRAGDVDIAVVFVPSVDAPPTGDIEYVHLLREEMQVGLPNDHRLARRKRLRLAELADEPWLQGTQGGTGGLVYRACVAAGFEPRIVCEVDDTLLIGGLVAAGVGLTFVSELALAHHRPGLAVVPLADAPARDVYAALLPSTHRPPAVAAMVDLLVDAGRRRSDGRIRS
jgi:DNA-binding transcriptional LysR family regulator